MPFWKKEKKKDENGSDSNHNGHSNSKEKINYKARLEHKQYLVSIKHIGI